MLLLCRSRRRSFNLRPTDWQNEIEDIRTRWKGGGGEGKRRPRIEAYGIYWVSFFVVP